MGWVSYMDDIQDRLDRDLGDLKASFKLITAFQGASPAEQNTPAAGSTGTLSPQRKGLSRDFTRLQAAIKRIEQIQKDVTAILEVATYPRLDAIAFTVEQHVTARKYEASIKRLEREVLRRDTKISEMDHQIAVLRSQLRTGNQRMEPNRGKARRHRTDRASAQQTRPSPGTARLTFS